ncbi:cytochrome d ubiquinol oxidase subunit II [Nesterenkonia massiliensis]|uniref:cytochrome d ubiquinol oxidase subunit II n=1 Tax=Nesterenkonia massiliensis TaxID=1232429 RepID=UPI00042462E9|nr:cytochrome d ubiquinol oxidase subunit II [Nesterenkonia massiliensis]
MDIAQIWFILVAFFFVGYFILDGFDFGVGMALPLVSRDNTDRRVTINTIGPVWDLNETWVIVAGAVLFAAFPEWYASLFSGFYLPLLLILLALIIRGVSFEYRHQRKHPEWAARFDWMIIIGSYAPAFLWGVAFANIVRGVAMDEHHNVTANLFELLNPYGLLGGLTLVLLCLVHGAIFLSLKADGEVRSRARSLVLKAATPTVLAAATFLIWTVWMRIGLDDAAAAGDISRAVGVPVTWVAVSAAVAALALLVAVLLTYRGLEGTAFTAMAVTIGAAIITLFLALYPNVLPSSTAVGGLTIENASSSEYTLEVMLWVALIMTPLVIGYQGWTYWVFRKRVSRSQIPAEAAH